MSQPALSVPGDAEMHTAGKQNTPAQDSLWPHAEWQNSWSRKLIHQQ